MIISLAWNFPLKLSSSTIFRGAESLTSDRVMSPNKLFSRDCNFYATLLKGKSPVYHVFSIVRQGVKGGHLYEGKGRKLKQTLSHYCACTKLRFSDRMLRIQKIHIVLQNLPKSLHHVRLSYTTKPSQNYRSMFPLTFDFSEIGSFQRCFHLDTTKKWTRHGCH